jgi:iron uptake system EfeUOB component EfeO/EfeM
MKVIAKISDTVLLCEVSTSEIGKLHGTGGPYDKEWQRAWVDVGAEHDMTGAFKAVDAIRSFDRSQLKYLKDRIDVMVKEYDSILQAYEKLTLFDKLSEDKDLTK